MFRDDMKVHSFRVDLTLIKRIKVYCAEKGITITTFVTKALTEYLEKMLKQ